MNIQAQRRYIARHGLRSWCVHCLCSAAGRAVGFKALRGMTLTPDTAKHEYAGEHPLLKCYRATAEEFALLPGAAKLESDGFYRAAASRGDWCYYFSDDGVIASYGWYSTAPVPTVGDWSISFSPAFVYMYNGFTAPEFRGQQLHAYGMAHALEGAVQDGFDGLISYVEAQNAGSLKSVARLGYRTFGTCAQFRLLGKAITFQSRGCAAYDFRLLPTARDHQRTA